MSIMESNNTFPVLNPNIYLNFLPHETANQFEVARNIYMATLGALIWDMLVSLPEDIVLIRCGFRPIIFSYFLARASALGYVLQSVISKTHPIAHCNALELGVTCCWVIATASSSFLFLRRVQALYRNNKLLYHAFYVLYLANVGVSIVVPLGSHVGSLANTGYCVNTGIKHYVAAGAFMPLAFDSIVFLAISYRIATNHKKPGNNTSWKVWITGDALPRLSKAVLQSGQQYYLLTVGANILISVLIVTPHVPPVYEAAFTIPDIALTSSMACRVYRNLRLAADRTEIRLSTIQFRSRGGKDQESNINTNNFSDTARVAPSGKSKSTLHVVDVESGGSQVDIREEIVFKERTSK
ncbi:hypothetical protein BDQ17DRAFT_1308453 [Cyathus striatus]|nr:hypothetical protein BDQ17DRAFT_1308453 [Cyathus striatus]